MDHTKVRTMRLTDPGALDNFINMIVSSLLAYSMECYYVENYDMI